ncbi:hypothetical protein NliqN6_5183 [Naganishia liquefaciens]|uniref:SRPBCC family protein n=1 Tax=Naganishia liquefaciens TaxID=104408 RepID=A0A8H3YIP5_9TREE|nr:hypothetical protein NliqN6_5183 [Naganishia liquefaciens]
MADYSHPKNRTVHTSITINAPSETIYRVITDFAALPEWSTFLVSVKPADGSTSDPLAMGSKLNVTINPPESSAMSFTSTVVLSDPPRGFAWVGGYRYVYLGKHMFLLEPAEEGQTKLVHREEFSGVLYTPIMSWMGAGEKTRRGFDRFNEEVKARAERMAKEQAT